MKTTCNHESALRAVTKHTKQPFKASRASCVPNGLRGYSTIVSCGTTLMKGVNVAVRPKRSVAVIV